MTAEPTTEKPFDQQIEKTLAPSMIHASGWRMDFSKGFKSMHNTLTDPPMQGQTELNDKVTDETVNADKNDSLPVPNL